MWERLSLNVFLVDLSYVSWTQTAGVHLIELLSIHMLVFAVIDCYISLQDVDHYHNSQPNHYSRKMTMHLPTYENNSFYPAALLRLMN